MKEEVTEESLDSIIEFFDIHNKKKIFFGDGNRWNDKNYINYAFRPINLI